MAAVNPVPSSGPPEAARPPVVVGVDGSEAAQHALRWAAHLAAGYDTELLVVGAWRPVVDYALTLVPPDWDPEAEMRQTVADAADAVLGAHSRPGLRLAVRSGHPAQVLVEASQAALLLVVGSRGRGGFAGLLLGSVSASVAEHARCPVLVVRGDTFPPPAA